MAEGRDRDELNRFWNALVAGERAPEPFALEARDMELVRRMDAAAGMRDGSQSAQQRWPVVLASITSQAEHLPAPAPARIELGAPSAPNGRQDHAGSHRRLPRASLALGPARLAPTPSARRERGAGGEDSSRADNRLPTSHLGHLATAALIVLTLTASLFLFGPLGRAPRAFLGDLPAFTGAPSGERDVVSETLLDTPVAALPAGHAAVGFGYHQLQPGIVGNWPGLTGTKLLKVEQGTIEVIGADGPHTLTVDAQIALPIAGTYSIRNTGQNEARIIEVSLLDTIATFSGSTAFDRYSDPVNGSVVWPIKVATMLPAGPGQVTLERLTLPVTRSLPSFTATDFDWIGISAGRLGMTLRGDRLPFRWDSGEERTFGNYAQLPAIPAGAEVTLRNAGDDALILYRLTITPTQ